MRVSLHPTTLGDHEGLPPAAGVAAQTDALEQTGRLSDMPVKILLDSYTAIILHVGLRVPFIAG